MAQISRGKLKNKNITYLIWFATNFLLSFFTAALILQNMYNASLTCLLLTVGVNSICSFIYRKKYFIFLMFNLCLFLFLIGRPFVSLIQGEVWWNVATNEGIQKAILSLELCLVTLPIGACIADHTSAKKAKKSANYNFKDDKMLRMSLHI